MKYSLLKLRFIIDRLSLRERGLLLATAILFILGVWYFFIFTAQQKALQETNLLTQAEEAQTQVMVRKQKIVQTLIEDNSVIKLLDKFELLKAKMKQFELRQTQFSHRYIGEEELAKLLYSLLNKVGSVSIDNFAALDSITPAVSNPATQPTERIQYSLILSGDYFSILEYLRNIETLPWELYWDKLNYKVTNYPNAKATIEFYTLKPAEVQSPVPLGGAT